MARSRKYTARALRISRRIHAKSRAEERYGLELTSADLEKIIQLIRSGRAVPVSESSIGRTVFFLEYKDKPIMVVYSRKKKAIMTFLPMRDDLIGQSPEDIINQQSKAKEIELAWRLREESFLIERKRRRKCRKSSS